MPTKATAAVTAAAPAGPPDLPSTGHKQAFTAVLRTVTTYVDK